MTNAKQKQKSQPTGESKTAKNILQAPAPQAQPAAAPEQQKPEQQKAEVISSPLGKAPFFKERLGRVHLAIWVREDKSGTIRFSVKLTRSYKTEKGFRDTSSLDQGDIAPAIALLTQAQAILPPVEVVAVPEQPQAE